MVFPKIKVRESPDSLIFFSYGSELVDYYENALSTTDTWDQASEWHFTREAWQEEVAEGES